MLLLEECAVWPSLHVVLYRACGRPECNSIVQCFVSFCDFVILLDFLVGKSRSKYSALNYDLRLHVLETGNLLNFVEVSVEM